MAGINFQTPPVGRGRGIADSLVGEGSSQQSQATRELGVAAGEETKLNAENKMRKAQAQQGNQELGGMLGATVAGGAIASAAAGAEWGSVVGPWGSMIGGIVGALAGGLFK